MSQQPPASQGLWSRWWGPASTPEATPSYPQHPAATEASPPAPAHPQSPPPAPASEEQKSWWSGWFAPAAPTKPAFPIFGVALDVSLSNSAKHKRPPLLERLITYLNRPGIFRLSGSEAAVKEMQALFDSTGDAPIEKYTIHDNVTLLKRYVSTLPESLFGGEAVYSAWLFVGTIHEEAVRVEKATAALTLLPPLYRHALHSVFHLLYLVAQQSAQNKMTANNLARSFALSVLYDKPKPAGPAMATLEEMQSVGPTICTVQTLIQHYKAIFGENPPPPLAADPVPVVHSSTPAAAALPSPAPAATPTAHTAAYHTDAPSTSSVTAQSHPAPTAEASSTPSPSVHAPVAAAASPALAPSPPSMPVPAPAPATMHTATPAAPILHVPIDPIFSPPIPGPPPPSPMPSSPSTSSPMHTSPPASLSASAHDSISPENVSLEHSPARTPALPPDAAVHPTGSEVPAAAAPHDAKATSTIDALVEAKASLNAHVAEAETSLATSGAHTDTPAVAAVSHTDAAVAVTTPAQTQVETHTTPAQTHTTPVEVPSSPAHAPAPLAHSHSPPTDAHAAHEAAAVVGASQRMHVNRHFAHYAPGSGEDSQGKPEQKDSSM